METFGEAVRRLRGSESLRGLAHRAHIDPGHLSRLERGTRPPTPEVASALDSTLGAGGDLVALATTGAGPWPLDSEQWRRRDCEALAAMLLAQTPTAANAVRLAHEWLIADAPQVYEVRAGSRIGASTVARVVRRVHQLRLLDDHLGGTTTHDVVSAELAATAALLREGSYTEQVGRSLLSAIGELCQLAGWVASDAGRHTEARRLYLAGVRAAHAGGDAATAANNMSSLAYQTANVGNPREAVVLARSAVRGAQNASATVRALLLERLSWAHARADEASQADRSLGAVDEAFRNREPGNDPPWTYWLSLDEVEIMAGRVWTQVRRPLRAVPILERATAGYDEERGRENALYLTWLAEALLQAREVERAADVASRALLLSRRAGSVRADDRVRTLRRLFRAFQGVPAVDDLEDEYRAAFGSGLT